VTIERIPMPQSIRASYQEFTHANIEKISKHVDIDWISVEDYVNNV
jgi:hypothetical protein